MNEVIENKFPRDFHNIKVYNELSLPIIDGLNQAFISCDKLLREANHNKYQNLIAIYFPHLMKLLNDHKSGKYYKNELVTIMGFQFWYDEVINS